MLSEHEKRELQAIEEMLLADTRLIARFRRRRRRLRGPLLPRVLLVSGVLVMVCAAFLGLGDAFVQGLALALAGFLWRRPWSRLPRRVMRPRDGRGD